ncbi:MAG: hypothetical protein K2L13_03915, partial [Opitutales bacterium]|nr:hypothetical protein [Opitutales bacterium]
MFARKNHGFALLFVLALASIFALSISILCTQNYITHLHIQHEISEQQARYGALFALHLAVARLQKFAGSDDVISAKANNFNDELQLKTDAMRNVYGLWKIVKENSQYFTKFLCWLWSQRDSSNFDDVKLNYNSDSVCLTKNSQYVLQVPKRQIQLTGYNGEIKWAFIIEDESQKIDLSLVDQPKQSGTSFDTQICPQLPNTEAVTTFSSYRPNLSIYPYIDFPEQFSLINQDLGRQVVNNQNLCTLHSYGVWAGIDGLKQELNYFLDTNNFSNTDTIFQPQPTCAVLPPTWKMLQSFVRQSRNIQANSTKSFPFIPLCRPQYMQNYSPNTTNHDLQMPTQYGIYPILTQVLFDMSHIHIS